MTTQTAHPATDKELYLRFRNGGDREAFDELIHRYEGELFRYLRRYLRNAALAEDVFQATFLRLYQKAALYNEVRRFRPWLYSIATHAAVDALRKAGRQRAVSLDEPAAGADAQDGAPIDVLAAGTPTPFDVIIDEEGREQARRAVDELPEHLRVVVILVFFQGLKYGEAAEALGIPLGTLKSRMHAAFNKLSEALREPQAVEAANPGPPPARETEPEPHESEEHVETAEERKVPIEGAHHTLASLGDGDLNSETPAGLARTVCLRLRERLRDELSSKARERRRAKPS